MIGKGSVSRHVFALGCLGWLSLAGAGTATTFHGPRLVFVYGKLRRSERLHSRLADQEFVGEGHVRDYALYVTEDDSPYAAPLPGGRIQGEVYRLDPEVAARIDALSASDGYRREPVWVRLKSGQLIVAEMYAISQAQVAGLGARRYRGSRWSGARRGNVDEDATD